MCWKDTACHTHDNKKMKNIVNILKMPYIYFISTKLDSKSGQIKDLDVTWQMHSITKIFDIVEYLKNETNQKLKKKERIGKMDQKGPIRRKGPNIFSGKRFSKQNNKKSIAQLNSVHVLKRYSLSHMLTKN